MTKNGYFSDLLKTLPTVWSFKYDNTILIDNPKKGDTFKSGDILTVKAYIDKIATYAILSIGNRREFKNLLEDKDKGVVTFSDYTFTDSDIGNLDVKVEVGRFMYLPSASQVVQIIVEGSGDVIINDWITLKSNPTESEGTIINIPNKAISSYSSSEKSWYAFENLNDINYYAKQVIGDTNYVISNELRELLDKNNRYWIAVGPNVMNPSHNPSDDISINEMRYGTEIDVVFQNSSGTKLYLPCVIGDVKAHTYPNGIYQTGFEIPTGKSEEIRDVDGKILKSSINYESGLEDNFSVPYNDRSVIEFIGNWPGDTKDVRNTPEVRARIMKGINSMGLDEYKIISIIVY